MAMRVDQRGAMAGVDNVAGDKTVVHVHPPATRMPGIVEQLLAKLQQEVTSKVEIRHTVENLKFFYESRAKDGIVGLEAKLDAGGRHDELYLALAKKEQFVKLLEKWSMYASAQEIFAYGRSE